MTTLETLNRWLADAPENEHLEFKEAKLQHPDGRVLVFAVPPRPAGSALQHEGAYLIRAGEELVPMSPDHLKRIFAEGGPDWFDRPAWAGAGAEEVVALLDTQSFFDLMQLPYPTSRDGVLERLAQERLIERKILMNSAHATSVWLN